MLVEFRNYLYHENNDRILLSSDNSTYSFSGALEADDENVYKISASAFIEYERTATVLTKAYAKMTKEGEQLYRTELNMVTDGVTVTEAEDGALAYSSTGNGLVLHIITSQVKKVSTPLVAFDIPGEADMVKGGGTTVYGLMKLHFFVSLGYIS